MTPLPPPLGAGALVIWRLDQAKFADSWDSGEGSRRAGGRWSSRGVRTVYASLDPSTAVLEVAVHKGFHALDAVPHVLTSARIIDPTQVRVVAPADVPDPLWLTPGSPAAAQQAYGDALLRVHKLVLIPSVISAHSWNAIFAAPATDGLYDSLAQEEFAMDRRLRTAQVGDPAVAP